ncbi:MAG TPA: energy-coupling factor ABC transporter substrate-binding protein [Yinghuangia sp.]|uniref:energy-coupling factor ABC transporter substrate-binding protein n=1 Tax=Yinghuangia sp. YIM S10712 TaxID=3436930 RepID=UPI002C553241|nr:energy-coupling factor ABC transporter substrate-binding protein [Yinghuangia sp.]
MKRATKINLLLVLAVLLLACLPLVLGLGDDEEEPFTGSDAQAETAITENDPDYEPWFSPIYEPPSGEIESGLFAAQAAIGAGVVGYFLGVVRTRRKYAAGTASGTWTADPAAPGARPAPAADTTAEGDADQAETGARS